MYVMASAAKSNVWYHSRPVETGFEARPVPPVEMEISPTLCITLSSNSDENAPELIASRLTGRLARTRDHSESGRGGRCPLPLNLSSHLARAGMRVY